MRVFYGNTHSSLKSSKTVYCDKQDKTKNLCDCLQDNTNEVITFTTYMFFKCGSKDYAMSNRDITVDVITDVSSQDGDRLWDVTLSGLCGQLNNSFGLQRLLQRAASEVIVIWVWYQIDFSESHQNGSHTNVKEK